MNQNKTLSNAYLSAFCLELSYILRSGMPLGSGLSLLRDDDDSQESQNILSSLCEMVDSGTPLSQAMSNTGRFPDYMIRMLELAERTGRMESTLIALSKYYEQQRLFRIGISQALLYPAMLLGIFLVVITVLVTQVLPIFDSVFRQLGTTLSPMAQGLLSLGRSLSNASQGFAIFAAIIAVCAIVIAIAAPVRTRLYNAIYKRFGGSGVWGDLLRARFASALATAIASGLDANESIDSAASLVKGSDKMDKNIEKCREILASQGRLHTALAESGVFSSMNSRMIALGFETGNIDSVMIEISQRSENSAQERLSAIVSSIEPTIVILTSLVAGVILLSVMLPLINIMSGIAA